MKLFVISAILRRYDGINPTMKLVQGYRGNVHSEAEALGSFIATHKKDYPDFVISDYLILEVERKHIEKIASNLEPT